MDANCSLHGVKLKPRNNHSVNVPNFIKLLHFKASKYLNYLKKLDCASILLLIVLLDNSKLLDALLCTFSMKRESSDHPSIN